MGDGSSFIKIGPAGSLSGNAWDEKGHDKIAQIFISHGLTTIYSIQFQYVENGRRIMSNRRGSNGPGPKFDVVKLNYPTEYITWISGRKPFGICSITFGTNHGQYGPFGSRQTYDPEFKFQVGDQFGGFHGYADLEGVNSIGVYLKPITTVLGDANQNNLR